MSWLGRYRLVAADEQFIIATAGRPFTHWTPRKLAGYLAQFGRLLIRSSH